MSILTETKQETLTLSAHTFADLITGAAIACASGKDAPYLFSAVYLRAEGGELVAAATDRYRLMEGKTKLDAGNLTLCAVSLADIKRITALIKPHTAKNNPMKEPEITLSRVGDVLGLYVGGDSISVTAREERFTDYSRVLSEEFSPVPSVALNMELLGTFAKVPHDNKAPTILGFTGESKAVQIRLAHAAIVWRGAIMPMRTA